MKNTPSMNQYRQIKEKYPDCIVLFRMGDFYETFEDDAYITSKVLDIALTSRDKGEDKTPMAGIPYHALMTYLPRLIQSGYKVALCEQLEDPKQAKGIVKRDVVRIITPGTALESEIQNPKFSTYILSIFFNSKKKIGNIGISYVDISKGKFVVYESSDIKRISEIIENISPSEILLPDSLREELMSDNLKIFPYIKDYPISYQNIYDFEHGYEYLCEHFKTTSLKGFLEMEKFSGGLKAAGGLLKYIEQAQKTDVINIEKIEELKFEKVMFLDPSTINNLELISGSYMGTGKGKNSLLDVLDQTKTNMGARLLRYSIVYPLIDRDEIQKRLDSVEFFYSLDQLDEIRKMLSNISDIERIGARISYLSASPRDFLSLKNSLIAFIQLERILRDKKITKLIENFLEEKNIKNTQEIIEKIAKYINNEDVSLILGNGNVINSGVNDELDELKDLLNGGRNWIKEFQEKEIKKTGINSLKVHYNKVFGYYIEISNVHKNKVPEEYIRKQTLVSSERYITPELKHHEDLILNAQDKIVEIEARIFNEFKHEMTTYIKTVKKLSEIVAIVDMLSNFAFVSRENVYTKPTILNDDILKPFKITNGRHPVIESNMDRISYIPNDIYLDCSKNQILLITGPNMSGKSSILRMCALISIMAQIGCFIPASNAELSIVDRVFSRVGARDNLSKGESTFMVEMNEVANILNNATKGSLIILDEIGRGTSTYDGVSIAYAVVEYIHEFIGAKTIFATHYHELIDLENIYKRVKNFNVSVKEENGNILFLRKLIEGGTDKSYGIHVAKIAGVPKEVTKRAGNVLIEYEKIKEEIKKADIPPLISLINGETSDSSNKDDSKIAKIKEIIEENDLNNLSPINALNLLFLIYDEINKDD